MGSAHNDDNLTQVQISHSSIQQNEDTEKKMHTM